MPLETANTIAELNASWPLGSDPKSQGDDHLRMIKGVMQNDIVAKSTGGTFADGITVQKDAAGCAFTATRDGINLTEIGSFGADGFVSSTGELIFSAAGATRMTADALGIDVVGLVKADEVQVRDDAGERRGTFYYDEGSDSLRIQARDAAGANGLSYYFPYANQAPTTLDVLRRSEIDATYVKKAGDTMSGQLILPANGQQTNPTIKFSQGPGGGLANGLYGLDDGNTANSEVRVSVNGSVALRIPVLGTLSNNAHVITRQAGDGRYVQQTAMVALLEALVASAAITPAIKANIESLMVVEP